MEQMYCVITLRRIVNNQNEGKAMFDLVNEKLSEHPEIEIHGHVTTHFSLEEAPE